MGNALKLFKNEELLSPEYVPSRLPHREAELNLLKTFFSNFIAGGGGLLLRILIAGPVGVGKTALARRFGTMVEEDARSYGSNVKYIHVNCKLHRSLFSVLKRVIEELRAPLPTRGLSNEEMLHSIISYLASKRTSLVLGLDEVDGLVREESDALYFLSRISEERPGVARMAIVMTTRTIETLGLLDEATRSLIQNNVVYLSEYTTPQLRDIVAYRASEAIQDGVVGDEIIDMIAEAAGNRGDARFAIEILWRAVKYAENESLNKVTPEHIRKATASIYPVIKKEILSYLSYHERLLLLAATRALNLNEKAYVTSSELNTLYRVVCEEFGVAPRAYTRFWEYLQHLEDVGIVRIKVSSEGTRGRRSYIYIPEVPVSILMRELRSLLERPKK
ncbi:MAG: ORC1-type DNA replication protein [Aigarchaeota archaeon]|nr:ORC1-type DNA replication protein [Aigarchaeota archaeon]MDW8092363.1 ORC1-type DNA replication protein [Nitrososphaerota archaeon]